MRGAARALACVLLLLFAVPVLAVPRSHDQIAVVGRSILGLAVCTDAPYGYIRIDLLWGNDWEPTLAHELMHLQQMARFRSCSEFHMAGKVRGVNASREAEAFCASAKVYERKGMRIEMATAMMGARLAHNYNFGLSEDSAVALVRSFCR